MNNTNESTRLVCLEAAQKLRTYVGIYTGDKQARRLIDELSNIAAALSAERAATQPARKLAADCIKALSIGYTDLDHLTETLHCADCRCALDAGEDHKPDCLVIRAREYLAHTTPQEAKAEQVTTEQRSAVHAKVLARGDEDHLICPPTAPSSEASADLLDATDHYGIDSFYNEAPAAPSGSIEAALPTIRDLDKIGMEFGAVLARLKAHTIKGADYLLRDDVMRELVGWRYKWDANAKARPDFRAARTPAIAGGIAEDMKLRDLMAEFHAQPQNSYEEETAENAVYAYLDTIIQGASKCEPA